MAYVADYFSVARELRPSRRTTVKRARRRVQVDDAAQAQRRTHLLSLRFGVFNLAAFALLGAAAMQGWVGDIVGGDASGLSVAITVAFFLGLALCARQVFAINAELNAVSAGAERAAATLVARHLADASAAADSGSRAILAGNLRAGLARRVAPVKQIANSLVLLGLIGTVVGFIIALSGVDPQAAGDPEAIGPMIGELLAGMAVALFTTLVGAVFNLWLTINAQILIGGAARLADSVIALGEADARARTDQ